LEVLLEAAGAQRGFVTTANAADLDVPAVELRKMAARGVLERRGHGLYRIVAFAVQRHDELIEAVLWAGGTGVISHESAVSLWGLADVNPRRIDVTVPRRTRRAGGGHYRLWIADLRPDEIDHHLGVPVTTPRRSIEDIAASGTDPHLVAQAIENSERHDHISERVAEELRVMTRCPA
jgi:predicted transcriptional regulator of viral defense system